MIGREAMQAGRAGRVKGILKGIGKNLIYYLVLMTPVAVIGSVWFNISPEVGLRTMYGGIPLIAAFVIAERAMMEIGAEAGKKDPELFAARDEFKAMRKRVIEAGTGGMEQFVLDEIESELETVRRTACRKMKLDYGKYLTECDGRSKQELRKKFGSRVMGAKVYAVSMIRPITLTQDMILCDIPVNRGRGGIGKTGEEYCEDKKGLRNTIWSIITVFVFAGISVGPMRSFSWPVVIYTLWALTILLYRMARGYKDGVVAYADVQVKNYRDRVYYMEKYLERTGETASGGEKTG